MDELGKDAKFIPARSPLTSPTFSPSYILGVLFAGTWFKLVGAISSVELLPLNLNTNVSSDSAPFSYPSPNPIARSGDDELRDVSDSGTGGSASKFISSGQIAKLPLAQEKIIRKLSTLPSLQATTTTTVATSSVRPIIQRPTPKLTEIIRDQSELHLQSESSPLSPIVVQELEHNTKLKSNLGTQQPLKKGDVFEVGSSSPSAQPQSNSAPSRSVTSSSSSSEETREKPTNINLLRKLWSSTRSSKLNLTHEHQSLLRIESEKSNRSSSAGSSTGSDDKKATNSSGSRSLLVTDLSVSSPTHGESSYPAPWTTAPLPTTITPTTTSSSRGSFISSTFGPKLTSLQPTSLKLGQEKDEGIYIPTSDPATSSLPRKEASFPSNAPESSTNPSVKLTFNDGTELLTSTPPPTNTNPAVPRDNKFPKPGGRRALMLYPEWLSSGGVYPDDSTNGTGEYYGEPEYENLINNNENKGELLASNLGEREEEGPGRRIPYGKRIHADFLERFANISSWQNKLRLRGEQQVMGGENRLAPAVSGDVNNVGLVSSTEAPEAIIAQNGLADVISRGRIDSVMYVYFGDRYNNDYHREEVAGRVIQVSYSILLLLTCTTITYPVTH